MADIVVSEDIRGAALDALTGRADVHIDPQLWRDPGKLRAQVQAARALIVRNQTRVDDALLRSAPQLQIVARAGAGCDNIDVAAASARGVVVSYTPDANSVSVAELTIGLILALARHIPAADRSVRGGAWARSQFMGSELSGRTLGIVGLGRIGRLVAGRARAFDMPVVYFDPLVRHDDQEAAQCAARLPDLKRLLETSDVVSCHVPLVASTRGLFDYDAFCQMKPSALFVNTSRGEVVEEADLVRALREHRLAGAALDVRQTEPPGASPLDQLEQVILLPHLGALTDEAQERVVASVCRDVSAVLAGQRAVDFVNFALPGGG